MSKINHFKARVEIVLRQRGWSYRELARRLDKSPPRLQDILERGDPKMTLLQEIAKVLGVPPKYLLEEVTVEEYGKAFLPTMKQPEADN